ncbi:hypothetical protein [Streptomyces sp. SCL15-4]|uniref:hypothetical protein n=1 Tax=Streptomyces sp. SCL15-4 TaxID=2967221 RepID=UPI002966C9DC|nr:hypothetical protein [Streptomyces sp. SCL15-4]
MNTRITAAAVSAAALLALTACSSSDDSAKNDAKPKPSATAHDLTQQQKDEIARKAGMPPRPTGETRQQLLDALKQTAPDVVRYEDKAVDAARNQCSAINGEGVKRIDWLAAQRFTYKDVTTTETQGKQINATLKRIGFCKV